MHRNTHGELTQTTPILMAMVNLMVQTPTQTTPMMENTPIRMATESPTLTIQIIKNPKQDLVTVELKVEENPKIKAKAKAKDKDRVRAKDKPPNSAGISAFRAGQPRLLIPRAAQPLDDVHRSRAQQGSRPTNSRKLIRVPIRAWRSAGTPRGISGHVRSQPTAYNVGISSSAGSHDGFS